MQIARMSFTDRNHYCSEDHGTNMSLWAELNLIHDVFIATHKQI